MFSEAFSDIYAKRDNSLTRADARIKVVFAVVLLLLNLWGGTALSLFIFAGSLLTLIYLRIPAKTLLIRLLEPFGVAGVVILVKLYFIGWSGLPEGLAIASRILGAVSLILLLSMTTPVDALLKALSWFRVPRTWTDVALLTYRYIFVLLEDAYVVYSAQRVRLGYLGIGRSFQSLGTLAGAIVIRAYDQAMATSQAMRLRGYAG
ncbi:MAG: cobalt ECF transporter T component CbiQ [Deltaproteobacteria bacterium]|nr:cobalt ECF transporter T component CbiQ [Deltaproteobacteria bacterium]